MCSNFNKRISMSPALLKLLGVDCLRGGFNIGLLRRRHPYVFFATSGLVKTESSIGVFVCSPSDRRRFGCGLRRNGLRTTANASRRTFQGLGSCYFSVLRDARSLMGRRGALSGMSIGGWILCRGGTINREICAF